MTDDVTFPKPMGQQLLIKVYDPQTGRWGRTFFGQPIAVDGQKPEPARGIVLNVGYGQLLAPSMERVPFDVQTGDEILFYDEYAAPITVDGEPLVMLNEANVLLIVSRLGGQGLLDRLKRDAQERVDDAAKGPEE